MSTGAVDVRCAVASPAVDEPLDGTAPHATAWVVLEQPGPWGRKALTESHLDPALGKQLGRLVDDSGVRVLLSRRPGHHADTHAPATHRTVWLASTLPGSLALRRWEVDDPRVLLDLDVAAIARGSLPDVGEPDPEPLLLVCTNARRDRCCAIEGRPATEDAARRHPGRVWECSHLGGHRFAPTALLLPHGHVVGRLGATGAGDVLDRALLGLVDPHLLRGRSTWDAPGQAAECAVRREHRLAGLGDVTGVTTTPTVVPGSTEGSAWSVEVEAHGTRHVVEVTRTRVPGATRPKSCGDDHSPVDRYVGRVVPR